MWGMAYTSHGEYTTGVDLTKMGPQAMQGNMTIQQFVGQTFGGCRLLQLVGVGGMGAVGMAFECEGKFVETR
jgi:hypothetical protein